MISDERLSKLSIAASVLGLLFLLFFYFFFEAKEKRVFEINENDLNSKVKVQGRIENVSLKNNVLVFDLIDLKKIKAVIFSPSKKEILIVENFDSVKVLGSVKEYRGELEIEVEEIIND